MELTSSKSHDVITTFDKFYNHYVCVLKERDEFVEKIKSYSAENERLATLNSGLQRDVTALQEMVANFHQMVTQIDSLKDKNAVVNEKCNALEQEMKMKEKEFQDQLQEQKKEHDEKLAMIIQSKEKDAEKERQRMWGQLEEKKRTITQLQETIAQARKEKEDEITVLSMEYENKLAKVQRQKSQILQNAQQTTNQDIFRKKLTHMKKTHEEESDMLKKQVAQLQSQIAARSAPPSVSASPQPSHFSSVFSTRNKRK